MKFEIIDFHAHPFLTPEQNICGHKEFCNMTAKNTAERLKSIGISKICGSVVKPVDVNNLTWESVKSLNEAAMELWEIYGDFYVPGILVHPKFVRESCEEIERMYKKGVRLIGELVPNGHGWSNYASKEFSEILDVAEQYNMVVNIHTDEWDNMDKMVEEHPNVVIVAAHPGEMPSFMRHMERMKMSENYYLDLSGTGIFRHGVLRHAVDLFGPERFLFGTDFPTCNPNMFVGGVADDFLLTDEEKEFILSKNAKRLLGLN